MQSRALAVVVALGVVVFTSAPPVPAAQLCGCKNSRGRIRRISQPPPDLICRSTQTLVCWNEDPPPGDISARVCRSTVLSVPGDSTNTAVPFDMERYDTNSIHDNLTNNTRLTATTPGKYLIFGHVAFAGTTGGVRQVAIYKSGDPIAIQNQPASATDFSISTHHQLSQGDYVELFVLQDSGGPVNISAGCHATQNYADDFGMVKVP